MKIEIENIGKIEKANVSLNGLTLIAGENGSGKSTIGKMLFSVIQVLKSTQTNSLQRQNALLDKYVNTLYTRLNGNVKLRELLRSDFFPSGYTLAENLRDGTISIDQLHSKVEEIIQHVSLTPSVKANLRKDVKNIELVVLNSDNRAAVQATSIQSMIESEFMNSVCSINTNHSKVIFNTADTTDICISFDIVDNTVGEVQTGEHEYIEDATYVESPLYLHMLESLNYSMQYIELESKTFRMRGMIPTHIKDFVSKMMYAKSYIPGLFDLNNDIISNIEKEMNGSFVFDKATNRLLYVTEDHNYSPINTASGTKTFGVLQLLLQCETIGPNRILIWDEPENHLHPKWQIKFADVILQLVQAGIPIVISTHSPYFIQAIRYYSAKYGAEKDVEYYFADITESGLSVVDNVTHDLNRVFAKLASPLNEVMNVDAVRKHEE